MENEFYNLIFHGVIADGHNAETVRKNIAELFHISEKKVERLFNGTAVTVKKNVDHTTALKYQAAFKKAGALCSIEEVSADTAQKLPDKKTIPQSSPAESESDTPDKSAVKELSIPQNLAVATPSRTKRDLRFSPRQAPSITTTGNELNFSRADMKPVPLGMLN